VTYLRFTKIPPFIKQNHPHWLKLGKKKKPLACFYEAFSKNLLPIEIIHDKADIYELLQKQKNWNRFLKYDNFLAEKESRRL
jgi:hypothetical protein